MKKGGWEVRKSEWSDEQLEELLRQMPKIQDDRNPRDIYQNLSIKKKKYPTWLLPGLATAAALLLFLILLPKLMIGTQYSFDKSSEEKSLMAEDNSASMELKRQDISPKMNGEAGMDKSELMLTNSTKTAIYDNEVGNGKVLTYWIPDTQGQILVPVSSIINIEEDKTWLTLFIDSMEKLKEEEWGLSEYYPLNATIELNPKDNSVMVDVPADHKYGQGSTSETNFINILTRDISSNSDREKIIFSTDHQSGIELGNYGIIEELSIDSAEQHAYFFYNPAGEEIPFIVPSIKAYKDINTALAAMKLDQTELGLKSSLAFQYKDAIISGDTLVITIGENSNMKDDLKTLYSFEALLLTAKEFGIETITIVNAPIKQVGPFDLTSEIKVPIAANFRPLQ